MPVTFDKTKGRWRYKFERLVNGRRVRATKVLPKGWSAAQADKYDAEETARLYALASGASDEPPLIEDAVLLYCTERCPSLKQGDYYIRQLKVDYPHYQGKLISELPIVAKTIRAIAGITDATKRNRIAYIRAACRYAFKYHGLGDHDPAERLPPIPVRNERHLYATRMEMLQLARACDNRIVRAMIRVAFYSGLRQGEILRAIPMNGRFVVFDTKNGKPVHSVLIHPKVATCAKFMPISKSKGFVQKHYTDAKRKAGLEHFTFHDLRHSAASALINAGVDLYHVAAILNHKDLRSTKRYAHLSTEAMDNALLKIAARK